MRCVITQETIFFVPGFFFSGFFFFCSLKKTNAFQSFTQIIDWFSLIDCIFSLQRMTKNSSESFYDLLEVKKDATESEIRSSYRKLARKWHPDRNPDNVAEAEAKFKRISKAYEVLTDGQKRKIYDQHGEAGLEGGMGGAGGGFRDPMDIFGDLFGFSGMRGGDRKSTRLNSSHSSISYAVFCLKKKK